MVEFSIVAALWLLCGIAQWGLIYAYFSRKSPLLYESRLLYIVSVVGGPVILLAAVLFLIDVNGFKKAFRYGFKL